MGYKDSAEDAEMKYLEKEYFMLREEIMTYIKSSHDNVRKMIAIYPLILGVVWKIDNPYFMFTPMFFVMSVFYINQSYWRANCKLSSYMMIILNKVDIKWERLLLEFDERISNNNLKSFSILSISPYYHLPLIGCYFFSLYKSSLLYYNQRDLYLSYIFETIILIANFLLLRRGRVNTIALKEEYFCLWENLKEQTGEMKKEI